MNLNSLSTQQQQLEQQQALYIKYKPGRIYIYPPGYKRLRSASNWCQLMESQLAANHMAWPWVFYHGEWENYDLLALMRTVNWQTTFHAIKSCTSWHKWFSLVTALRWPRSQGFCVRISQLQLLPQLTKGHIPFCILTNGFGITVEPRYTTYCWGAKRWSW